MGAQVTTPPPPPPETEYKDSNHDESEFHILEFHMASAAGGVFLVVLVVVVGCCLTRFYKKWQYGQAMRMASASRPREDLQFLQALTQARQEYAQERRAAIAAPTSFVTQSGNAFQL